MLIPRKFKTFVELNMHNLSNVYKIIFSIYFKYALQIIYYYFQVLYCLRHYKGDEKIRNFIWDLIEPCENGEVTISRNHSGLHNPVPRGRNAKKKNRPKDLPKPNDLQKWEDPNHWSSSEKYDCEAYLESSYKKHLFRHANK